MHFEREVGRGDGAQDEEDPRGTHRGSVRRRNWTRRRSLESLNNRAGALLSEMNCSSGDDRAKIRFLADFNREGR